MRKTEVVKAVCNDITAFLVRVNPDVNLAKHKRDENMPTLKTLDIAFGDESAVSWLLPRLCRLTEYVGTKQKLTHEQAVTAAQDIASGWSYLDCGEIDDFIVRFRTGEFGPYYSSDDPQKLLIALREYCKKRSMEIAAEESAERQRQREQWATEAKTWQQFCEEKGINEDNPLAKGEK